MQELAKRFKQLYAGVIYDAMAFDIGITRPFVVSPDIKPLWRNRKPLVGPAFCCSGRVVPSGGSLNDTQRIKMLDAMSRGCVQVIDGGGDDGTAHFGDISALLARLHGAVGVVIDGYTRDARRIERQRFPLFASGTLPTDAYGRWEIVTYQVPIMLHGAKLSSVIAMSSNTTHRSMPCCSTYRRMARSRSAACPTGK